MARRKSGWAKTNVSWDIRKVIWLRWAFGDKIKDILKFLELNADQYENAPVDRNTIRNVMDELKLIPCDLVVTLISEAPELKSLILNIRQDCSSLINQTSDYTKLKGKHMAQIHSLLQDWRRDIRLYNETRSGVVAPIFPVESEKMFPLIIQHCPSLKELYEEFKRFNIWSFIKTGPSVDEMWELAETNFNAYGLKLKAELIVDILSNIKTQLDNEYIIEFKPFNAVGLSNTDNDRCCEAQKDIYSQLDAYSSLQQRRKLISYFNHLVDNLYKAIEKSLNSHEYLNNRCNWCPE